MKKELSWIPVAVGFPMAADAADTRAAATAITHNGPRGLLVAIGILITQNRSYEWTNHCQEANLNYHAQQHGRELPQDPLRPAAARRRRACPHGHTRHR